MHQELLTQPSYLPQWSSSHVFARASQGQPILSGGLPFSSSMLVGRSPASREVDPSVRDERTPYLLEERTGCRNGYRPRGVSPGRNPCVIRVVQRTVGKAEGLHDQRLIQVVCSRRHPRFRT